MRMIDGIGKLINDTQNFLPHVPELVMALLIGFLLISILVWSLGRALGLLHLPRALILIVRSLLSVILWIILIADILRMAGLNQVAITLSGSLLVIGLAVANGANALVSDVISGLFLAKDPDFDVGFLIKAGEVEGTIESIDIRKIRIRTGKHTLVVVPNSVIDKERFEVLSRPSYSRSTIQKFDTMNLHTDEVGNDN